MARAPPITLRVFSQISMGSCSTQPASREDLLVLDLVDGDDRPAWSKIIARVLVVPWSIERM